jgi:hypothetical protein
VACFTGAFDVVVIEPARGMREAAQRRRPDTRIRWARRPPSSHQRACGCASFLATPYFLTTLHRWVHFRSSFGRTPAPDHAPSFCSNAHHLSPLDRFETAPETRSRGTRLIFHAALGAGAIAQGAKSKREPRRWGFLIKGRPKAAPRRCPQYGM